jgi:hypothetical protein
MKFSDGHNFIIKSNAQYKIVSFSTTEIKITTRSLHEVHEINASHVGPFHAYN